MDIFKKRKDEYKTEWEKDRAKNNTPFDQFKYAVLDSDYAKALRIFHDSGDESYVKHLLEFIERDDIVINEFEQAVDLETLDKVESAYLRKWGVEEFDDKWVVYEDKDGLLGIRPKQDEDNQLNDCAKESDQTDPTIRFFLSEIKGNGTLSRHEMHEIDDLAVEDNFYNPSTGEWETLSKSYFKQSE